MVQTTEHTQLINALRAAAEAFLAALDQAPTTADVREDTGYDPLFDQPPFTPNPAASAPLAEQHLAAITYLGGISRINAEHGRGATTREVRELALKAGYSGGNAVNGWNSRPGSPRAVENIDGARWLNTDGLAWITRDAANLNITITGPTSAVPVSS